MGRIELHIEKVKDYNVEENKYLHKDLETLYNEYLQKMSEKEIINFVDKYTDNGLTYAITLCEKAREDIDNDIIKSTKNSYDFNYDNDNKEKQYRFYNLNTNSFKAWCKKNDLRELIYCGYKPSFRIFDYEFNNFSMKYSSYYNYEKGSMIEVALRGLLEKLISYENYYFIKNDEFEKEITEFEKTFGSFELDIDRDKMKSENPVYERLGWVGSNTREEKRKYKREVKALLEITRRYHKERRAALDKIEAKHKSELQKVYNDIMEWNK